MSHVSCVWFVYAQFIQSQLSNVKQDWKYHEIGYSKGCHISGIPNQLHHLPESKGCISQGYHVTESNFTIALAEKN